VDRPLREPESQRANVSPAGNPPVETRVVAVSHFQTSFPPEVASRTATDAETRRQTTKTREESGTQSGSSISGRRGPYQGPDTGTRNGRLKEVLLRDKPEVIRLSRGKLSFLPAGFFVGLRPPTNIHSRLTLLFTVCGYLLVSPHPGPPEFSRAFCRCFHSFPVHAIIMR